MAAPSGDEILQRYAETLRSANSQGPAASQATASAAQLPPIYQVSGSTSRCAHREDLDRNEGVDIPHLNIMAVKKVLCYRCLKASEASEGLKTCGGCKRVSYCSRNCQKLDWEILHKKACKVLKEINNKQQEDTRRSRTWAEYVRAVDRLIDIVMLHKELDQLDNQVKVNLRNIVVWEPHCSTCRRSAAYLDQKTTLTPCPQCQMVSTCGDCPPSHPADQCAMYQKFREDHLYIIDTFEEGQALRVMSRTEPPRRNYLPLSSASNWHDYFVNISDKSYMAKLMSNDLIPNPSAPDEVQIPREARIPTKDAVELLRFTTQVASMPLTILAALEHSLPGLHERERLSIDIIGATGAECREPVAFEEIVHLLPRLKRLQVTFIGPDVPDKLAPRYAQIVLQKICTRCSGSDIIKFGLIRGKYHEAKDPQLQIPDIAVLFNSGRTQREKESWAPTTRYLVDSSTLTLCTTLNAVEMREEVAELNAMNVRFVEDPAVNTWRSLVNELDIGIEPELEHALFYRNYFRYVFKGRKEETTGL